MDAEDHWLEVRNQSLRGFEEALNEAFQAGFRAGSEAMRASILRAVDVPMPKPPGPTGPRMVAPEANDGADADGSPRAPRGLVSQVLSQVLGEAPGSTMRDIQDLAEMLDNRVNRKTVYNELNRKKGDVYRLDGDKWFLIGPAEKETSALPEKEHADVQDFS